MMWQAVGQTKLDMLFSASHKQTQKMLNHKRHVFSLNQERILPLQSELCKIVNRLAGLTGIDWLSPSHQALVCQLH